MWKAEAKDMFLSYIKKKGLRNTKQREKILEVFFSADGHITIDGLYAMVKKRDQEIGYATVYRNLKLIYEAGLADEIKIGNKKTRYERKYGREHHDHLICLKCDKLIEIHDDKIERLQDKLAETNDFIPLRHKLEIYGLCKKCK